MLMKKIPATSSEDQPAPTEKNKQKTFFPESIPRIATY